MTSEQQEQVLGGSRAGAGRTPNSVDTSTLQFFHEVADGCPGTSWISVCWGVKRGFEKQPRLKGCAWDKMKAAAVDNFHPLLSGHELQHCNALS